MKLMEHGLKQNLENFFFHKLITNLCLIAGTNKVAQAKIFAPRTLRDPSGALAVPPPCLLLISGRAAAALLKWQPLFSPTKHPTSLPAKQSRSPAQLSTRDINPFYLTLPSIGDIDLKDIAA